MTSKLVVKVGPFEIRRWPRRWHRGEYVRASGRVIGLHPLVLLLIPRRWRLAIERQNYRRQRARDLFTAARWVRARRFRGYGYRPNALPVRRLLLAHLKRLPVRDARRCDETWVDLDARAERLAITREIGGVVQDNFRRSQEPYERARERFLRRLGAG